MFEKIAINTASIVIAIVVLLVLFHVFNLWNLLPGGSGVIGVLNPPVATPTVTTTPTTAPTVQMPVAVDASGYIINAGGLQPS